MSKKSGFLFMKRISFNNSRALHSIHRVSRLRDKYLKCSAQEKRLHSEKLCTWKISNMHRKWNIIVLILSLLSLAICEKLSCNEEDFSTVIIRKARSRVGNHIWTLMINSALELKFGVKGYLSEDSRWILNQYFKGSIHKPRG